ncbi:MAG: putative Ig domain-containing protein [Mycobacterium sp.]
MSGLFTVEGGTRFYLEVDGERYTDDDKNYSTSLASAQERALDVAAVVDTDDIVITTQQRVVMNIGVMNNLVAQFNLRAGNAPTPGNVADIVIDTVALPDATIDTTYVAEPLQASGGDAPYTWTVVAGALPTGLSIVGEVIQGTPTGAAGAYNFTLRAADGTNNPGQKAMTITMISASSTITITDSGFPSGQVGVAYSFQLTAVGGTGGPYTWVTYTPVPSSYWPDGLTLSSSGLLSGTPTTTHNGVIDAIARDGVNPEATLEASIVIAAAPTVTDIQETSLPDGIEGAAYSQQLTALGGDGTYVWSLVGGTLPSGLSLSAGGLLSGTPDTVETANFTIECDDEVGTPDTQAFSVDIASSTQPVAVTTISLSPATDSVAYSQQLAATGGDGSYTWSVTAGSLPSGISLSSGGALSGTHSGTGTFNFTVEADDGQGNGSDSTDTQALSLTVAASGAWITIDWDYTDRADMIANPPGGGGAFWEQTGDAGGLSQSVPVTLDGSAELGPAVAPWGGSHALRNEYPVIPHTGQPQVALNYVFPNATRPSEFWQETYMRFGPTWQYDTPPNPTYPGGNIDKKSMFWFEDGYAQRWELKFGPYGSDCIASMSTHDVSYHILTDPVQPHPQSWPVTAGKILPVSFVDVWRQIRVHLKMSTPGQTDAIMDVWIDGVKVGQIQGVDSLSGTRKFRHCTFGGNKNQGTDHVQSEYWGRTIFYLSDPGW